MGINVKFRGVRVHVRYFAFVNVFLTRARIFRFVPLANGNFAVAVLRDIGTVYFSALGRTCNVIGDFLVSNDTVVLARSMGDGTRNVGLFLYVRQHSFTVRAPVGAAGLFVMGIIGGMLFNANNRDGVFFFFRRAVYNKMDPRGTNVGSDSFLYFKRPLFRTNSAPMRAAILFIRRSIRPVKRSVND